MNATATVFRLLGGGWLKLAAGVAPNLLVRANESERDQTRLKAKDESKMKADAAFRIIAVQRADAHSGVPKRLPHCLALIDSFGGSPALVRPDLAVLELKSLLQEFGLRAGWAKARQLLDFGDEVREVTALAWVAPNAPIRQTQSRPPLKSQSGDSADSVAAPNASRLRLSQ